MVGKCYRHGWVFLPLLAAVTCGCERSAPTPPPPRPPEVLVSVPVVKEITDYEDFTGRTESVEVVEIRARVTGYLEKIHFKDGADVEQDQLLFEIDPRPYQAELARAEANLRQSEARLKRLQADFERAQNLRSQAAVSREEFDKISGDRAEAESAVGAAKASRELAQLNMTYTKIRSPFSGRISRHFIDPGNLVKADETILTAIGKISPVYATFDIDERTVLRIHRLIQEGKVKSAREADVPVLAGLADEEGFPHEGIIDFVDNHVDAGTGTLRVRGRFANESEVMFPGLFVRVRVPLGSPRPALLIAEQALGTDQGQKFVYVINDKDEAIYRRVHVGRLSHGLRVINEGLMPDERVVVSGIQRVRPNTRVTPKMVDMPMQQPNPKLEAATPKQSSNPTS